MTLEQFKWKLNYFDKRGEVMSELYYSGLSELIKERWSRDDSVIASLFEDIESLQQQLKDANEVLAFYAAPDTYHAIAFMADSPCGEFADDFSDADDWTDCPYNRPMPGKRAREVLAKYKGKNDG